MTPDIESKEAYALQKVREFANKLCRYYDSLNGVTYNSLVAYTIRQKLEQMIKEDSTNGDKED